LNKRSKLRASDYREKAARPAGGKLAVLRHRDFRRFYAGYTTSLLGSAMSGSRSHSLYYAVAAGAFAAGSGSAVFGTYFATVQQQRVPPEALARVTAFDLTGAYALGSAGFVVIGPLAAVVGPGRMLGFAAAYTALSSTVVLSLRSIRSIRQARPAAAAGG
jgi:hypothetical protein